MNDRSFSSMTLLAVFLFLANPVDATPLRFLGIEANEADLKVALAWPTDAEAGEPLLAVRDSHGNELASAPLFVAPGKTTSTVVHDALMAVAEGHLEYTVTVLDGNTELLAPLPFRVRLDCPKASVCRFTIVPGLSMGGAIDLDPRLATVLDSSETHDLQGIIARWPELRGAVYTYSLALESGGVVDPSSQDCVCAWTAPVRNAYDFCRAGAFLFENEPETIVFHEDSAAEAEISIEMQVRCSRTIAAEAVPVITPAGQIVVSIPDLAPCADEGCTGLVTHDLKSHTLAEVVTTPSASALASATIDWFVDGNQELNDRLTVQQGMPDSGLLFDHRRQEPATVATVAPTLSKFEYHLYSEVDLVTSWAEGGAHSRVISAQLESWGWAGCAVTRQVEPVAILHCPNNQISLLSGDRP